VSASLWALFHLFLFFYYFYYFKKYFLTFLLFLVYFNVCRRPIIHLITRFDGQLSSLYNEIRKCTALVSTLTVFLFSIFFIVATFFYVLNVNLIYSELCIFCYARP